MTAVDTELAQPPRASGEGDPAGTGHLEELRVDPIGLMERTRAECGDVGVFRLADRDVVLLTGPDANEIFFRAPDEDLDQAEAYPFMTPIFGEGVVFDADPEERRKALHNQALRDKFMRGHAATIAAEVDRMTAQSPAGGEIDLLDWFAELTIYTSSACLIGKRFREQLDGRFAHLYHDLERGTDALAYVDPYADIESFRARDAARVGLVELVQGIMDGRAGEPPPEKEDRDLLDVLMSIKDEDGSLHFSAHIITGMFISMMFAGHHTTSGTAAWTLIELLQAPRLPRRGGRGARRPRGGEPRGQLPGPAGDAEAGGRHQGGAAAAPAAHHPAARGQGAGGGRRLHDPAAGRWWRPARRCRTAIRRPSTMPRRSTPPATSSPARTTSPTRGAGSPSAPAATAAWAPPSP